MMGSKLCFCRHLNQWSMMEQKGGELGEEMDLKNRTMLEEESSGW